MLSQMYVQTTLLRETFTAQMTPERFLLSVHHPVCPQQIPGRKILTARVTLKRFFARVCTHVMSEARFRRHVFPANVTDVHRSFVGMRLHVHFVRFDVREHF